MIGGITQEVGVLRHAFVATALAAFLGSHAAWAARAAGRRPPSGDPRGLALLERVHRAYAGVAAVAVSGSTGALSFRFTLDLSSGIVAGEQFVGREPSKVTVLVARRGGPTFAREPGTSCWRALRRSDPQAFENIGLHFPDQPAMSVRAPRATATGWLLPVVIAGGPGTLAIDRNPARVRSITVGTGGTAIVEHVTILKSVPRLSGAEPRC